MKQLKVYVLLLSLVPSVSVMAQSSQKKIMVKRITQVDTVIVNADTTVSVTEKLVRPDVQKAAPSVLKYFVNAYPEYTVLVKAINAVELNTTFESGSPVTVFAPLNRSFNNVRTADINNILKPEMRDSLKGMLTYIVVSGEWRLEDLIQKIKEGGGSYSLPTVGGTGKLTFVLSGATVFVKDNRGTEIALGAPVVTGSGLVYPVDKLLLP